MLANFSHTIERTVLISNPRFWAYGAGTYLSGVALGISLFKESLITTSSWYFIICLFWIISVGMIMGFSHSQKFSKLIFPWEFIFAFFKYLTTSDKSKFKTQVDIDTKISIAIGGVSTLLFFLVSILLLNIKILVLGASLLIVDFLYNSKHIEGRYIPFADILFGVVYMIPFLIGYIFITDTWPDPLLLVAGAFFFAATELYGKIIEAKDDSLKNKRTSAIILGEKKSLLVSIALIVLCGIIFASYEAFYFLFVAPFLLILIFSLYTKDRDGLLKMHAKTPIVHSLTGFLAISYFFI